ncbi:MAG: hypothetical protein N2C14_07690 [Planctomycetales bacterium]
MDPTTIAAYNQVQEQRKATRRESLISSPTRKEFVMRMALLTCWLIIPFVAGAYHFGPGQRRLVLDQAQDLIEHAQQDAADEHWAAAETKYEQALELLPEDQLRLQRHVRVERAKAQMFVKKLPTAHQDMKSLVDEMAADENADRVLLKEARQVLANSQYYITWLMRLEGKSKSEWEPEIESARQTFRLLAEDAKKSGDAEGARQCQKDLESAIRLARMDVGDLQGLPLPSQ